jgi:hypothetical protein
VYDRTFDDHMGVEVVVAIIMSAFCERGRNEKSIYFMTKFTSLRSTLVYAKSASFPVSAEYCLARQYCLPVFTGGDEH